jgi:hypothetical protein
LVLVGPAWGPARHGGQEDDDNQHNRGAEKRLAGCRGGALRARASPGGLIPCGPPGDL